MRLQILVGTYIVGSIALAVFVLAHGYSYSGAEFHCLDLRGDLSRCIRSIQQPIEIKAGIAALIWLAATGLIIREWKKK